MGRAVEVIERDIEGRLQKNPDLRAFAEELDRVDGQMVNEPVVGKRLDTQHCTRR
jgi:hypothetical protein